MQEPFGRPEALALDGVYTTMDLIADMANGAYVTILTVALDRRVREHSLNLTQLRKHLGTEYGLTEEDAIPARIAVAEAVSYYQTIWEYESAGIADVRAAYQRLITRILKHEAERGQLQLGSNHAAS